MTSSGPLRAIRVRVGQVGYSLAARLAPADDSLLAALSPAERALFDSMRPADRAHGLRVARRVQVAGYGDPRLLKAALLHDVGKAGHGIHLPHRVARVLLTALTPQEFGRIAATDRGWHEPFYALAHHAAIGADLLAAAGSDPLTVALVRSHDAPNTPAALFAHADWLHALKAADDAG